MTRFVASQLRHRTGRALTLALGIVVAAVAFVLLTGSTRTSELRVTGTLKSNYRNAYDILVRPKGSTTPLERQQGLVRPNYLSGIYGGITVAQYNQIEHIRGVEVAAPIANIGYLMFPGYVNLPLRPFLTGATSQLFRVRWSWVSNDGLSRYPATATYLYYTPSTPPEAAQIPLCTGFDDSRPRTSGPFDPNANAYFNCSWPSPSPPAFKPETSFPLYFPVLLAAIDPVQEARLLHLDNAVVRGRYLREGHGLFVAANGRRVVSVLASTRTFLGDRLVATVERLRPPADTRGLLRAGACETQVVPCPASYPPPAGWPSDTTAYGVLRKLPGQPIATRSFSAGTAYLAAINRRIPGCAKPCAPLGSDALWTTVPSRYRILGNDHLAALSVSNPLSIWRDPMTYANNLWFSTPPQNRDVQFRRLHEIPGINRGSGVNGAVQVPGMRVVGRFDPKRLPGFSPLSKLPLETFYPPELLPADRRSRRLLHDKPLLPTQNLGDYVQQPPLLLTSIDALGAFTNPNAFTGMSRRQRRAPISVMQIRVAGVTGTDQLSQLRIRTVATEIHQKTGLDVDLTAGSSPHPIDVSLPAGKFGRPKLLLREGWSKKGATISYLNALDRKDLALFALVLVVCAIFLLNGALAAVRARRAELGTLLTLGWSRGAIFGAVLGELALIGLVAGAAGTGLAALLVKAFALALPLTRTLLVLPIALGLAVLGGLVPAWQATRGTPLDALHPPVRSRRRGRNVQSLLGLALVNLARLPLRTALGTAGLALGVAALTVLVAIERSFQGTLVGTLLGNAVSLQVRGPDFVAIGLTIALAAVSAADVLYLNLRERSAEFVTLETTGWSSAQISQVVLLEAAALALVAAIAGSAIGILIGGPLLGVPYKPLGIAALIAGAGALSAALLASLIPARQLLHVSAPAVLAAE